MSDSIVVIDKGGYIGKSTKLEIEYAKRLNKSITYYYNPENDVTASKVFINELPIFRLDPITTAIDELNKTLLLYGVKCKGVATSTPSALNVRNLFKVQGYLVSESTMIMYRRRVKEATK